MTTMPVLLPAQTVAAALGPPPGLPARAGLGLKPQHFQQVLQELPDIGFFEVHAENYMVDGGPMHQALGRICQHYPLSLHGVGLSIGGEEAPDEAHLARLAALIDRYQPAQFSEHLAWSSHGGVFFNDLLPLPWTAATLQRVCDHVDRVQTRLRQRMLLENPASYLAFANSTMDEAQFLTEVQRRTGCGLLLDLNNAHVTAANLGGDAQAFVNALPLQHVQQVHLAGFAADQDVAGIPLLIDNHGTPVHAAVWQLHASLVAQRGALPTLIERDNDVPALAVLLAEAQQAEAQMKDAGGAGAAPWRAPASC